MRSVLAITLLACFAHAEETQKDEELPIADLMELANTKEFQDKFAERFITKLFDKLSTPESASQDLAANETSELHDAATEEFTNKFANQFITKLFDRVLSDPALDASANENEDSQLSLADLLGTDTNGHQMTQAEADQASAEAWAAAAEAWAKVAAYANAAAEADEADLQQGDDNDAEEPNEYDDERDSQYDAPEEEEELAETDDSTYLPYWGLLGFVMGSTLTLAFHRFRNSASAADKDALLAGYTHMNV